MRTAPHSHTHLAQMRRRRFQLPTELTKNFYRLGQVGKLTKSESVIAAELVVQCSAQQSDLVVIVGASPLLADDPGEFVPYRRIPLDGIAVDPARIITVPFAQGMYNGIFFSLGLLCIDGWWNISA